MNPKYIRVLQALEKGAEVKLFNSTLVMGEDEETGQSRLSFKMTKINAHYKDPNEYMSGETVLFAADIPVNEFIKACEELDEVDIPIVIPTFKG